MIRFLWKTQKNAKQQEGSPIIQLATLQKKKQCSINSTVNQYKCCLLFSSLDAFDSSYIFLFD
jgi:hypothetical protein